MNPDAASAANAAYGNAQYRARPRLSPVREHPWEQDQRYLEQLRKPASPGASRNPPWRPYQRYPSSPQLDGSTPTQMLDSMLGDQTGRATRPNVPAPLFIDRPSPSRALARTPQREEDRNVTLQHRDPRFLRRPHRNQLQVRSNDQLQRYQNQDSHFAPYDLSAPISRNHVPPDLIEGARVLLQAGIQLPVQGSQGYVAQPQHQEPREMEASSPSVIMSNCHELPAGPSAQQAEQRRSNPVPQDLLESMERLTSHDVPPSTDLRDGTILSEMPNSAVADIAGSNYELLAVADSLVDDRISYSRIAIAGLSGSGKTHCLRLFLTRLRMRSPSSGVLEVDISDSGAVHVKHDLLSAAETYSSLGNVTAVLQRMGLSSSAVALVVVKSLNQQQDAGVVQAWGQHFFRTNCCIMITTQRLDIAKSFATGQNGRIITLSTLSAWTARHLLSNARATPAMTEAVAKQLSYHPSAIIGTSNLLKNTGMAPAELSKYLHHLISDPSRQVNASTRLALQAANESIPLSRSQQGPLWGQEAGVTFAILVHCVQRSWLDIFREIQGYCPVAMMMLGVLAAMGEDEMEERLISKIQHIIGSKEALQALQARCLVTMELVEGVRKYRCPAPVLIAVQVWMSGRGELDRVFELADAVAQMGGR